MLLGIFFLIVLLLVNYHLLGSWWLLHDVGLLVFLLHETGLTASLHLLGSDLVVVLLVLCENWIYQH